MNTAEDTVAYCALNKIFGYHPCLALHLLETVDRPADLFLHPAPDIPDHPELTEQLTPAVLDWAALELEKVREGGFRFIGLGSEDYPEALRECEDPPLGLYLNGTSSPAEIFSLRPMVAVVGTRDISPYGKAWCRKLVEALSRARVQPCIVSGLAYGADGIAHRTALDCGLPTLGIMATGIGQVYPWQHRELAADMVRTPGSGVLTDYPTGTAPVALNFVRRNRIIAGLARGVIVVESKSQGGSLMTAKYAVGYSREVYALPGRADDTRSAGCNSLIHTHMAEIITTPEELVDQLGLGAPGIRSRGAGGSWKTGGTDPFLEALKRRYGAGSELIPLALAVREQRGTGPETLSVSLSRPYPAILEGLSLLEADGFVTTDMLHRCSVAPGYD